MKARAKREAKRRASALGNEIDSAVALKGRNTCDISALQALNARAFRNRGDALARFALPLAVAFRAFGSLLALKFIDMHTPQHPLI